MAVIATAATLAGRIPVLHFFDGFRTSHEVAKIVAVDDEILAKMLPADLIGAHRTRALSPEHPVLRGTSQNPDVFFQAREAQNPWFDAFPGIVQPVSYTHLDVYKRQGTQTYGYQQYCDWLSAAGFQSVERIDLNPKEKGSLILARR